MNLKKSMLIGSSLLALFLQGAEFNHVQAEETTEWIARELDEVLADIQVDEEGRIVYTIQYGDALSVIAEALNIQLELLEQVDAIEEFDLMFVDTELRVSYDKDGFYQEEASQLEVKTPQGFQVEVQLPKSNEVDQQISYRVVPEVEVAEEAEAEEPVVETAQDGVADRQALVAEVAWPVEESTPSPIQAAPVEAPAAPAVEPVVSASLDPEPAEVGQAAEVAVETLNLAPVSEPVEETPAVEVPLTEEVQWPVTESVQTEAEGEAEASSQVQTLSAPVEEVNPVQEPVAPVEAEIAPDMAQAIDQEIEAHLNADLADLQSQEPAEEVYEDVQWEETYEEPAGEEVYEEVQWQEPVTETPAEDAMANPANQGLQPHVAQYKEQVGSQYGITDYSLYRPGDPGDHGKGKAVDFMVYGDTATGDAIANQAVNDMVNGSHGISYVIWKQQINGDWTNYQWQMMEDRGNPTQNHFDHVHVSFH